MSSPCQLSGFAVQVRVVVRGADTVLGDAASATELFLTTEIVTACALALCSAQHRAVHRHHLPACNTWEQACPAQQCSAHI